MDPVWSTDCDTINALPAELSPCSTTIMATAPQGRRINHDPHEVQNANLMDFDIATVTRSSWRPTSSVHQTRDTNNSSQLKKSKTRTMANTTSTKLGKTRAPVPSILIHPHSTHVDDTLTSGSPERNALTTVTTNQLFSPESPRTLRRTNKRLSLSSVARPTADRLAPPDPLIPLSPPPIPASQSPHIPNTLFHPHDSPAGHQRHSGVVVVSPTITCSPPTPPSPSTTQGMQLSSPLPSPNLPRIGTAKRPYYSAIRASMNSRPASDVSQLSSPPTSPSSITFPTSSPVHPSRLSTSSANFRRSEASLIAPQPHTSTPSYGSATSYSYDHPQKPAIVTVPPLPPLLPLSPSSFPFHMRASGSSSMRSGLSVLDLSQDEDDVDYYGQFGRNKVRLVKYWSTKKSGNAKEKHKNPLSLSLSSGRRRNHSFGFGSDQGKVGSPFPALFTSRSFTGLASAQGCSMSGEMELRMTLAERDFNSENGSNVMPFKFRQKPRPSDDGREKNRGKGGGRKLVKARSSAELAPKPTSGLPPTSRQPKPKIGFRLRKMMSINFLGKFQGNDAIRS